MRRFEMEQKFWEVATRGATLVVRFGKLGTAGQTKEKELASAVDATKEAERLVRDKTRKGYVERGAKHVAASRRASVGAGHPSIATSWARIESVFAKKHSELDLRLRPPATLAAIAAAEKALGIRFPDDYRASLRVHDGQEDLTTVWWMPIAQRLASLDSMVTCWKGDRAYFAQEQLAECGDWLDRSGRVRQIHLHPRHVPIAGSAYWDYDRLMLDYAPGPKGTEGQVIARSDIDLLYVAPSFEAFLARVGKDLASGATKVFAD